MLFCKLLLVSLGRFVHAEAGRKAEATGSGRKEAFVGCCCGTTPEFIRAVAEAIDK